MISHSSIALAITTNNNADYQPVNSFKPINYLTLPIEMHHKILKFCTVNTLLSLRKTAKKFYDIITPEIMRSKIYQENISSHSTLYSISCYENFIAPILTNLNPQLKENISQYLAQTKNKDSSFKKASHFIGGEIVIINDQFEKKKFTVKNINLPIENPFNLFAMSKLSNNCVFSTRYGQVILYYFSINNILNKVTQFYSNKSREDLCQLEFSPKNNLLVLTYNLDLLLWKLNLNADPLIKNEVLWKLNLNNSTERIQLEKIIMFQNEQQFICHSLDRISIWNIDDKHQTVSQHPIEDLLDIDKNNDKYITDIVMSSNNNCIAMVTSPHHIRNSDSLICLFSRVNNQTQFIQDSITYGKTFDYYYKSNLQLNAKGNICVYINNDYSVILLNKFDDIWHNIVYLDNCIYLSIELSPYDTHLYFITVPYIRHILAISLKNICLNSITSDATRIQINNDKLKYSSILKSNVYNRIKHTSHPTGLAMAIFDKSSRIFTFYHLKK